MSDIYSEIRAFIADLQAANLSDFGLKLKDAVETGSTGGEIFKAVRWNLKEMLNKMVLPQRLRKQAESLLKVINATGI